MADALFRVNGTDYPIPEELTLGELCDAEDFFGVDFTTGSRSSVRVAAALLWIAIRRVDDSVTVDDIRALPPDVFTGALREAAANLNPQNAEDEPAQNESFGAASDSTSAITDDQNGTGDPGSATGSVFAPEISAS